MYDLSEKEVAVLDAYARCGMRISRAAKELFYSNGSIIYYFKKVKKKTGLDPRNFYELAELLNYKKS